MGIVDHQGRQVFEHAPEQVFDAAVHALRNSTSLTVNEVDDASRTIYIKAGISLFSWGEMITVSVNQLNGQSEVLVMSTPKTGVMFGGAMDMGKNRKNINLIMQMISEEIKVRKLQKVSFSGSQVETNDDIPSQIKKLAALRDEKLITEEEFQEKKKVLLSRIK